MLEGTTAAPIADRLTSFACQQVLYNLKFSFPSSFGENATDDLLGFVEREYIKCDLSPFKVLGFLVSFYEDDDALIELWRYPSGAVGWIYSVCKTLDRHDELLSALRKTGIELDAFGRPN